MTSPKPASIRLMLGNGLRMTNAWNPSRNNAIGSTSSAVEMMVFRAMKITSTG
jgi:hypothetical protein